MFRTLVLLAFALNALATNSMEAYSAGARQLISAHRNSIARLTAPTTASATALLSGGTFFLSRTDNPAWFYEGIGRAGGVMQTQLFDTDTAVNGGDVVWMSYTASNYRNALDIYARLNQRGVVVVALGPSLPTGPPPFYYWVDSLTPWSADDHFALLGNLLSLWTMEGELAAATARRGKSLVFWQSILAPGSAIRNARYADQLFHDGFPQMRPVVEGSLSATYLDNAATMFQQIADELPQIAAAGALVAHQAATGNRATLVVTSHLLPFITLDNSDLFDYISAPNQLDAALARSGFLINMGYTGMDLELWRKVRVAKAQAIWVTGELPNQSDFSGSSDIFIDQHWGFGDASVLAQGYDVRLLPLSGIAQLFIYDLLLRAAHQPQ
jgi:hypothetical protein